MNVPVCSVAQFTTDDIGLIWLTSSNQTTAALTYLRTLASNTSYGILGESSILHHQYHYHTFWLLPAVSAEDGRVWVSQCSLGNTACVQALLGRLYACIE